MKIVPKFIRKWAAGYLLSQKPEWAKEMIFQFVDSKGVKYYGWDELIYLPKARMTALESLLMWVDARISPDTLKELTDALVKANADAVAEKDPTKRAKIHATINVLAREIGDRGKYTIPEDVFIRMVAVMSVREDEDPGVFVASVNEEKFVQFKEDFRNGHGFFFDSPMLVRLRGSYLGIEESAAELLIRWARDRERHEKRMEIITRFSE